MRVALVLLVLGCSSPPEAGDGGADGASDAIQQPALDGSTSDGPAPDAGPPPGDIGAWKDAPGACPMGQKQVDITNVAELAAASRGDSPYNADPPDTCYLLHNGTYAQVGATLPLYVVKGGSSSSNRRVFIGESRAGVIIRGRASIPDGVSHVVIQNLTFDLNGYAQGGSFNTLDLMKVDDVVVSHVTFTGDCKTGANGGHIELTNGTSNALIEACLIEKFGRCGTTGGHQDHGIYIANTKGGIVIKNNDIRGNSSRGVQFNTEQGAYGTIDGVTVAYNRIHDNGHADYEDGIVLNGAQTGTITNVAVEHNLIYNNWYSGIRTVDQAYKNITVDKNTFYHNGAASPGAGRGEIVLDATGSGANERFSKNVIAAAFQATNSCYDATSRMYAIADNVVQGTVPMGAACVTMSVAVDPMFANPAGADFHAQSAAAQGYGAYAP